SGAGSAAPSTSATAAAPAAARKSSAAPVAAPTPAVPPPVPILPLPRKAEASSGDPFADLVTAALSGSPRLATALKHGGLRAIRAGELTLAYPKGDFRASQLSGERGAVESLLAAHFGVATTLKLV